MSTTTGRTITRRKMRAVPQAPVGPLAKSTAQKINIEDSDLSSDGDSVSDLSDFIDDCDEDAGVIRGDDVRMYREFQQDLKRFRCGRLAPSPPAPTPHHAASASSSRGAGFLKERVA